MIVEVLRWDGPVGEGINDAEFCTVGAIAKFNNLHSPYLVANEYLAARLGLLLSLPVPPVALVHGPQGELGIISLRIGSKGETPPPIIAADFAADHPALAAAIVAFDAWIGNDDRHHRNLAYSRAGQTAPFLFDHDRTLLGATFGQAATRLADHARPCTRHCLGDQLVDRRALGLAIEAVQALSDTTIARVCRDAAMNEALDGARVDAVVRFLLARRGLLPVLVRSLTPKIKQGVPL